jgi:hypothetical protein
MAMAARNELVRTEAATIRRYAAVMAIKRRALDPTPIADDPREQLLRQKKPRAVLIIPAKYVRMLQACMCLRAR